MNNPTILLQNEFESIRTIYFPGEKVWQIVRHSSLTRKHTISDQEWTSREDAEAAFAQHIVTFGGETP